MEKMDLQKIKVLAEQGYFDEALAMCRRVLKAFPKKESEILRVRAYVFALLGNYEQALKDREAIFELGEGTLSDYYLAGDNALTLGKFVQAAAYLKEVLHLGREKNEPWFESASYFLLSYVQMELGNYEEALSNLESSISRDPKCAMPLVGRGTWDHNRLRKEILRKMRKNGNKEVNGIRS